MRVLAITNVFPNAAQPLSSPFNRQQFAALGKLCEVEVLATVPWFPGARRLAPRSAAALDVPAAEIIDGLPVLHPRTLHLPKIGAPISAPLYAASLVTSVLRYRGQVDVVLGSWAHPDGCAAVALARLLGVPAVVKLHGSDLNFIAKMPGPRQVLRALLPRAAAVIAVSRALADEAADLGVARERIHLVMNGVDGQLFHLRDRAAAREALGVPAGARAALFVGNLKATKGVGDLLEAFRHASAADEALHLYVVGDGPERAACEAAAAELPRLHVLGARPLAEVPEWMAACDVLVLPSWNEGTPNVVLEALACGRRVVATRVGGVPDLVTSEALGELVAPRDPAALGEAICRVARAPYDPAEVARLGSRGDWEASARALYDVLARAAA